MYVPAEETVIDGVVAPVDHNKLVPDVVNTEFPQLFDTVTIGVEGIAKGAAVPDPAKLVQPPEV